MPIQYGEFTIIYNEDEVGLFNYIFGIFNSHKTKQPPQFIILFEDGEICEINDKLKDFKYKFLDDSSSDIPRYIDMNDNKNIYFKKQPVINNKGQLCLKFDDLFKSYTKYSKHNIVESVYNFIYYYHETPLEKCDIFGVVQLKSSNTKPRFQFAYNSDKFSKEEVIYIINYIFITSKK